MISTTLHDFDKMDYHYLIQDSEEKSSKDFDLHGKTEYTKFQVEESEVICFIEREEFT